MKKILSFSGSCNSVAEPRQFKTEILRWRNALLVAGGLLTTVASQAQTVFAWGNNADNQCNVPAGLTDVIAIDGGNSHTVALKSNGTVVAWGNNGNNESTPPVGLTNVVKISAGGAHTLALKSDSTVIAWGWGGYGQTSVPAGLRGVIDVVAGSAHSFALKSNGTVVVWGNNDFGQLNVPGTITNAVRIGAGLYHNIILKADGSMVAWGNNGYGQCDIPSGLTGVQKIVAGGDHTMVLKSDGTVVAWGRNNSGQSNVPAGLSGVTDIAVGIHQSIALKSDGTIAVWGNNDYGQRIIPTGLGNVTAIGGGGHYSLAVGAIVPTCPGTVTFSPNMLFNGERGFPYEQQLSQTGLTSPAFAVTAGSLPAGLTLSSAGVLSGTPSATGTSNFTVKATSGSCTGTKAYSLVIDCPFAAVGPTISAGGSTAFCPGGSVSLTASGSADGYIWTNGATGKTITVTEGGGIGVQAIVAGCTTAASQQIFIMLNPAPATPTISATGSTVLSLGGSVVLTSSAISGNLWSTGATTQSITVNEAGSYTVQAIGICTSAVSVATVVTIEAGCTTPATPTISASGSTALSVGGSVTLTAFGTADAYLWSNGATTQSIIVSAAGSYSVQAFSDTCASAVSAAKVVTVSASFTACGATIPVPTATLGSTVFYMSWPTNANITSYRVQWRRADISVGWSASPTYDGTRTGFKIENLLPNTPYQIRLGVTCSGSPTVVFSEPQELTTLNLLCSNPVIIADTIGSTRVALKWASNSGIGVYEMAWAVAVTSGWSWTGLTITNKAASPVTGYRINNLQPNTNYIYRMRVVCANGYNDLTRYTYGTFTTTASPSCTTPTPEVILKTTNNISLTWPHNPSAAKGYFVRWQLSGASTWVTSSRIAGSAGSSIGYTIASGLSAGLSYNVQLSAICSRLDEQTAWSNSISVSTNSSSTCFTPVIDSLKGLSNRSIRIHWTPTTNVNLTEIQYRALGGAWSIIFTANVGGARTFSGGSFPVSSGNVYEFRMRVRCADNNLFSAYQFKTITLANGARAAMSEAIINIYPNPSSGLVNVSGIEQGTYAVFNTLGQQVLAGELNSENAALDLSNQANGMYLLKVVSNGTAQTKQIVISR